MTQQSALCSFLSFIILEWLVTDWLWHVGHTLSESMHIDAMDCYGWGPNRKNVGKAKEEDEPGQSDWPASWDDKKHNVSGSFSDDH